MGGITHSRAWRAGMAVAAAWVLSLGAGACRPAATDEAKPTPAPVEKRLERGPVTVVVRADRAEMTIAERLKLSIEVTAEPGYEVALPSFGEKLESFGIVDYSTTQPELIDGNRTRTLRTYVLEPFLSGAYTVPAMKVTFRKKGGEAGGAHEAETEPFEIKVTSLLPENVKNLAIHDIVAPVELPASPWPWVWGGGGAALLAAACVAAWWVRRRRRAAQVGAASVPPHERAYRELAALVAEDLVRKGELKRFYQQLSDILRRYIEARFGLHAPERTTAEFLEELRTSERLNRQYRPLLQDFLTQCDLVKFAEHLPGKDDVQKVFNSCKSFIVGTEEKPAERAGSDGGASPP